MNLTIVGESKRVRDAIVPSKTVIKVVGIGGGGGNAINCMIENQLDGVEFIAINTDLQALEQVKTDKKIAIACEGTSGGGSGGSPETGELAAQEYAEDIKNAIKGADMIFITTGMGGGTGTGGAPVVAEIAKELGALVVAVVTTPFSYECRNRHEIAADGVRRLKEKVDTLIVLQNSSLNKMKMVDEKTPIKECYKLVDKNLYKAILSITDIITVGGYINIDFNDVKAVMAKKGEAVMGVGHGKGENKVVDATTEAMDNPLIENSKLAGAKGVLINIISSDDLSISDIEKIVNIISDNADNNASIKHGTVFKDDMQDEVKVTVIATGVPTKNKNYAIEEFNDNKSPDFTTKDEETHGKINVSRYTSLKRSYSDDNNHDNTDLSVPTFLRQKKDKTNYGL